MMDTEGEDAIEGGELMRGTGDGIVIHDQSRNN